MADEIITREELVDAKVDAKDLGECVNGNETGIVTPRYGDPYPTLPEAIHKMENVGGIISAPTLTALQAIVPTYDYQLGQDDSTGNQYRWNPAATPPQWVPTGRNFLTETKTYVDNKTKNIYESSSGILDEKQDKNFNTYQYTDLNGGLFLTGINGSVQDNFQSLYNTAKNIPSFQKNVILAELKDSAEQVFAYFDIQGTPYFLNDIYISGKSLSNKLKESDLQARYQNILMEKFQPIKSLVPIALKSEDNLIKRIPAAIKTPTGLVYFYHKQIAGFDGDLTGSELWKAIITIDDNLNVNVVSRELFLAPDQPRGIVKHPMLGRTSDGRIILMYEKRLETSDNYTRYQCYSNDHGLTFTTPTLVTPSGTNPAGVSGYSALGTTGTITTAKNGRLIVPMYTTGGTCYCIYSDDDGVSWRFSGWVNTSQVSGYEPSISLDMDDNLIMDVRPKTATYRLKAKSYDNGETWKFFEGQQIPSATNQGVIFRDKEIGAMIQANDAMQSNSRTKYSLFISYDNAVTYPFVYMPFSETWYGGYCQILKWKDGVYVIAIEYADTFTTVNSNENAGLLILSLREVLINVSRN
ncbi:sialidase family protein [Acinetobacter baumannii]